MAEHQRKSGAVLSFIMIGATNIIGLCYTPYLLRVLGQNEYGLYSLASSVIAYLTIMDLGLGNTIVRFSSKYQAEGRHQRLPNMYGMIFMIYLVIAIVTCIIGYILYTQIDYAYAENLSSLEIKKVKVMMLIMILNISFSFPLSIFTSIITAYEKFIFLKSIHLLRIILNTLVMILVLEMGYKSIAMVCVMTFMNFSMLMSHLVYAFSKLKIKIKLFNIDKELLKKLGGFSFYLFIGALIDRFFWSSGQVILGIKSGTAAIAIFAVGIQLNQIYIGLSTSISSVLLPKVTKIATDEKSNKTISDLFIKIGRIQFAILSFILSGFIVFGYDFIRLWAGKSYNETYYIVLAFFIPLIIPLTQNTGILILQARNQMKFRAILHLCIALLCVTIQTFIAEVYGPIGCALVIGSSILFGHCLIMNIYYYTTQKINIPKFWSEIGKIAILPAFLILICSRILRFFDISSYMSLLLCITIYTITYLITLYIVVLNTYEKELVMYPIRRFLRIKQ